MNMMKKLTGITLTAVMAVSLAACAGGEKSGQEPTQGANAGAKAGAVEQIKARGKLSVGVKYDLNLFGLKDPASGKVEGFDIDLSKAIAKKIFGDETKIELKEVTSKTRIPMLKNGEIDMIIATMTITEDRKKEIDFSDVYFMAGQSLLVKKDSKINGLADLNKNTKIVTAKGSTSTTNIRAKAPEAPILEFENYAEAFTALKAGQGDALTTDNALLYGMAKQDPNYRVVQETFTEEPYGIGMRKNEEDLVALVNSVIKEMQTNGEYDKLYQKWIGEKQKK